MAGYVERILYDTSQSQPFLKPDWKKVIEDYPNQFILGTDTNSGRFVMYDSNIYNQRNTILQVLKKDASEKIAYKNAWKLMTGEDWKD